MADLAICKLDICNGPESGAGSKDGASDNAPELALINEARERDQKNKEDLKKIRRLIVKESKKQIKINLRLQNVQTTSDSMRRDNRQFEDNVKRILSSLRANVAEGKLKPDNQLVGKVKEAVDNFGAKFESGKQNVGKKREDCDRVKKQLDDLLSDQERKRHVVGDLKGTLRARKDLLAKLEQTIADWLKDFYRTIRSQPKKAGLSVMKAFEKAMDRILEMANESEDLNNQAKALRDELQSLQDNWKMAEKKKVEDQRFADYLETMANRYLQAASLLAERHDCSSPVPRRQIHNSCSDYLVSLHEWFTKELQNLRQQTHDGQRQVEQSRQKMADSEEKRTAERQKVTQEVAAFTDKRDKLKAERDELQAAIDKAMFDRCRNVKQAANQLKRMVKETVDHMDSRLPQSDKEDMAPLERSLIEEEREAKELERKVEKLQRRIEQQLEELKRLESEIAECEKLRQQAQRDRRELEKLYGKRIELLQCRKNELLQEVEKAQKRAQKTQAIKADMENATLKCEELEREIREKGDKARNLRQELENLKMDAVAAECRADGIAQFIERLKKLSKFRANRIKREKQTLQEINDDLDRERAKRPQRRQADSPMQPAASERECKEDRARSGASGSVEAWSSSEEVVHEVAAVMQVEVDTSGGKKQFAQDLLQNLVKMNVVERKLTELNEECDEANEKNDQQKKREIRDQLREEVKKITEEEENLAKKYSDDRKGEKSTPENPVAECRVAPCPSRIPLMQKQPKKNA